MAKPHLVIISDSIRRDLHQPLSYFKKVRVTHLWRQANYQDMTKADWQATKAIEFDSTGDLWRLLKKLAPNLVQGPEPFAGRRAFMLSAVVWWYTKKTATPYLFPVLENRPILVKHGWFWGSLIKWWTRIYGRGAVKVLYLNEGARRNLLSAGVPEKKLEKKLWGNWGVDTQEFAPAKLKVKSEKLKVLFVGKISVAKGVPWLIEAMEQVVKQYPKAQLWLAGPVDPNYQLSINNYLFAKHLGVVKNKDMAKLYRQAGIVAAPSITTKTWEEQVGNVILQAMACGVPVVTTNSGAIPEYVKDGQGAILVPERDSKAIAVAISRLLENSGIRATQSRLARRWIRERYEVRKNIAHLDSWLVNLLRLKQ